MAAAEMSWSSDEETLAAALDFVDAFADTSRDGGLARSVSGDADVVSSSPSEEGSEPSIRVVKNARSNRLKNELTRLRNDVAVLEKVYVDLRAQRRPTGSSLVVATAAASRWKGIAARQLAQRRRAETENASLHTQLEEQMCAARMLERMIKRRFWNQRTEDPFSDLRLQVLDRRNPDFNSDQLIAKVQEMTLQVDTVFNTPWFKRAATSMENSSVVVPTQDGTCDRFTEVFDSRVLPFEARAVLNAMWHHMNNHLLGQSVIYDKKHESLSGRIHRDVESLIETPHAKILLRGLTVGQRFAHNNAEAFAWASVSEIAIVAGSRQKRDQFSTTHHGWTLLCPVVQPSPSGEVHALVQSYQVSAPSFNDVADSRRRASAWTGYMESMRFQLEQGWQTVENLLVDGSWRPALQPQ